MPPERAKVLVGFLNLFFYNLISRQVSKQASKRAIELHLTQHVSSGWSRE